MPKQVIRSNDNTSTTTTPSKRVTRSQIGVRTRTGKKTFNSEDILNNIIGSLTQIQKELAVSQIPAKKVSKAKETKKRGVRKQVAKKQTRQ
jgi:hypothetical protein